MPKDRAAQTGKTDYKADEKAKSAIILEIMNSAKNAEYKKLVVAGGNDAGAIHKSRGGVKTLTVSVPCRYLHSPGCVIKYSDAENSFRLIKALAEDFAK